MDLIVLYVMIRCYAELMSCYLLERSLLFRWPILTQYFPSPFEEHARMGIGIFTRGPYENGCGCIGQQSLVEDVKKTNCSVEKTGTHTLLFIRMNMLSLNRILWLMQSQSNILTSIHLMIKKPIGVSELWGCPFKPNQVQVE